MSANTKSTLNGSFVYDKIFPLVDYCGNIRECERSGSQCAYSPNFSPNNIRRLILSPDAALCHYHIPTGSNGGLSKVISLSPSVVGKCESFADYKPMVGVLATSRICASVEEIIFLTHSNDGSMSLSYNELDFNSLVKTFKNQGSLLDTVKSRYKRLHDFTIINMNYNTFMTNLQNAGRGYMFICDLDFVRASNPNIKLIHDEPDWYKSWGSAAQAYNPDRVGGSLHTHFTNLVKKYDAKKKEDDVKKFTGERTKELEDKFEKAYTLYKKASKCYIQISKATSLIGTNVLFSHPLDKMKPPALYACDALKDKSISGDVKANSEKEALTENIKILNAFIIDIHDCLMMFLLKNLAELCQTRPISAKVLIRQMDNVLIVPALCRQYASQIESVTGVRFDGKNIKASLINVSWYCANMLFSKSGKKFTRGEENRCYWEDLLS